MTLERDVQLEKAFGLMLRMLSGGSTVSTVEHCEKNSDGISVIPEWILIVLTVSGSIDGLTRTPIVTVVSEEQSEKQGVSTDVMRDDSVILLSDEHPENAKKMMYVTVSGSSIVSSDEHPANAL